MWFYYELFMENPKSILLDYYFMVIIGYLIFNDMLLLKINFINLENFLKFFE